jgi:hypothetical protein
MRGQLPSIKPIKACGGFNRFFIAFHVCSQSIKLRRNSSNESADGSLGKAL